MVENSLPNEWPNSWKRSPPQTAGWLRQAHRTTLAGSRRHHLDRDKLLVRKSPLPNLTIPKTTVQTSALKPNGNGRYLSQPKATSQKTAVQTVDFERVEPCR